MLVSVAANIIRPETSNKYSNIVTGHWPAALRAMSLPAKNHKTFSSPFAENDEISPFCLTPKKKRLKQLNWHSVSPTPKQAAKAAQVKHFTANTGNPHRSMTNLHFIQPFTPTLKELAEFRALKPLPPDSNVERRRRQFKTFWHSYRCQNICTIQNQLQRCTNHR